MSAEVFDRSITVLLRCYLCGQHENRDALERVQFEGEERLVHRACRYAIQERQEHRQQWARAERMDAAWFAEVERNKAVQEQVLVNQVRVIKLLESIDRTLRLMDGRRP